MNKAKYKSTNYPGFFLSEFIISLMLASAIMLTCTVLLLSLHRNVSKLNVLCVSSLKTSGAAAVIMRELSRAPSALASWKKYEYNTALWNNGNRDLGLDIVNGRLVFYRGTYNALKREWTSKTQSTLLEGVRSLTFEYQKKDRLIKGIRFSFVHENKTIEGTVACANKIILKNVVLNLPQDTGPSQTLPAQSTPAQKPPEQTVSGQTASAGQTS